MADPLELDGTYHNLALFFDRVGKFTRIVNISGLDVKGKERPEANSTITATCTATTFVLLEKPAGESRREAGRRRRRATDRWPRVALLLIASARCHRRRRLKRRQRPLGRPRRRRRPLSLRRARACRATAVAARRHTSTTRRGVAIRS